MSMLMGSEHFEWRLNGSYQCIIYGAACIPGQGLNAKVFVRVKFLTATVQLIRVPCAPIEGPVL